jgi:hypothetical protein
MTTFMKGCLNNDPAAVEASLHATGKFSAFAHDFASWLTAQTHLDAAILARFGRQTHDQLLDAWTEPLEFGSVGAFNDALAALPSCDTRTEGNRARITGGARMNGVWMTSESLRFIDVKGQWKIDLDAMRDDPDSYSLAFPDHYPPLPGQPTDVSTYAYHGARESGAMNHLADEIQSGKIATADQAARALAQLRFK